MLKIDMHIHVLIETGLPREDGNMSMTVSELTQIYDRHAIERGTILPIVAPEQFGGYYTTNEMAMEISQKMPERFSWFMNADPRWITNSPNTNFSYLMGYYKERGAKGIGEMTSNIPIDDPRTLNLMRHAEINELPMTIHLGDPGFGDYGLIDSFGLPGLENALAMFPKLTIIGHSQKFWSEISGDLKPEERGGYPTGRVIEGGRLITLMRKYPNLHADLSAGSGYNAITRDPEFGCRFLDEFADKLYYATDICAAWQEPLPFMEFGKWLDDMRAEGNISAHTHEAVCRKNACRVLGIA